MQRTSPPYGPFVGNQVWAVAMEEERSRKARVGFIFILRGYDIPSNLARECGGCWYLAKTRDRAFPIFTCPRPKEIHACPSLLLYGACSPGIERTGLSLGAPAADRLVRRWHHLRSAHLLPGFLRCAQRCTLEG